MLNWSEIAAASATLFLIMDPLGNAPIFYSVLFQLERQARMLIIVRELLIALFILFAFLLAGNHLMHFFGLSQPSLSIAGGILLFIISLRMIFPSTAASQITESETPFIVPLAIPLIAGPSTIAVLLLLSSSQPNQLAEWSIALLLAWLATTLILLFSPLLLLLIGKQGSRALERLMGMILIMFSTQMLLNGIREFLQTL